ncbi:MAG: hypothetical protein GY888_31435, partial [Planctomycetaceae bacterium]|nr:hypothetical protein [Planctomycetaceae bacterium]
MPEDFTSPADVSRIPSPMVRSRRVVGAAVEEQIACCEQQLEYTFQDKSLLMLALTHASGADHRLES